MEPLVPWLTGTSLSPFPIELIGYILPWYAKWALEERGQRYWGREGGQESPHVDNLESCSLLDIHGTPVLAASITRHFRSSRRLSRGLPYLYHARVSPFLLVYSVIGERKQGEKERERNNETKSKLSLFFVCLFVCFSAQKESQERKILGILIVTTLKTAHSWNSLFPLPIKNLEMSPPWKMN
ncbi:hypothetical protein LX32DRAFT_380803 [Colletotrichum zoysiae]|uniref:Uncharacterized protein n=1 Tax=Colletotrichum zoysiae TaxID=1216348 RepID=A0AAD9HIH0_9PEZI|nr:hypothetical protein LX32DRAFT_380803 [Colletotrichum zoysiae]